MMKNKKYKSLNDAEPEILKAIKDFKKSMAESEISIAEKIVYGDDKNNWNYGSKRISDS